MKDPSEFSLFSIVPDCRDHVDPGIARSKYIVDGDRDWNYLLGVERQLRDTPPQIARRHSGQIDEVIEVEAASHRQNAGTTVRTVRDDLDGLWNQGQAAVDQQTHFTEDVLVGALGPSVDINDIAAVGTRRHGSVRPFD